MDYEKKYKEALERARQFSEHPLQEDSSNIVEYIFPELKESEDERIRKLLVEAVTQVLQDQYCSNRGVSKEKVVAWLEKQGQTYTKKDVDDAYVEGIASAKNELKKQGKSELKDNKDEKIRKKIIETFKNLGDGKIPVDINYADIFTWLENQGEQKPTDKVEPKFHEGEWITIKE